jgi:hypothetical protein
MPECGMAIKPGNRPYILTDVEITATIAKVLDGELSAASLLDNREAVRKAAELARSAYQRYLLRRLLAFVKWWLRRLRRPMPHAIFKAEKVVTAPRSSR